MRSIRSRGMLLWIAFIAVAVPALAAPADRMEQGFLRPPDSAKPHTWWHWMNGNITRRGITLDLEAMKRVGVGGVQIFDVTDGILPGPVDYMSDEWRGMVRHAVSEADRLGLEVCLHNCAGWSSSGGKWITPGLAMQMLVTSERHVKGPARFEEVLPQPHTRHDYYRDIAVIAFPTPEAEAVAMADLAPKVTASAPGFDGSKLLDGDPGTQSALTAGSANRPAYVQFEFADPFTARSLTLAAGGTRNGGERCEVQVSDDGAEFRRVAAFGIPDPGVLRPPLSVGFEPVTARFFRLVFTRSGSRGGRVALGEARLEPGFRVSQWALKSGYDRANPAPDRREVPEGAALSRAGIVDLTTKMDAEGRLKWDVPEGNWTVVRFGHTPTGKDNHPAPEPGRGLECDKMSREAADAHWNGMLAKVIADVGPLAGKTLKHTLIDSYEVYCQNWTPRMREEFRRLRGYDLWPYLPALTGRVVENLDLTERFLWDFRRTLADLYAEHYFGRFAELCHQHGMLLSVEPYGNGNFEDMQAGGRGDIPMSEFWAGQGNNNANSKLASSVAHTYGRKFVGAEAFTADSAEGRWQNHPYALKGLGDYIYTGGVNRFIFHRYAHQPWDDLFPGMTMGPHGFHFDRTNTWFEQGAAWLQYLARCQYLLQEGLFAADLCYFTGEGAPVSPPGRDHLRPAPPAGYDYDACSAEVILTRISVKEGRIVLPDGMGYRILVLPQSETMSPALLRKIRDLVRDGATVLGPKPARAPGLQGYPASDAEVAALAAEVWGPCDGKSVTENRFGKGTVIWGKPLEEVLAERGLQPDFEYAGTEGLARLNTIHRVVDGADVYFVASQSRRPETVECTFRVSGRAPELWHPDTGRIEPVALYRVENGRTTLPIRFDPVGSVFVVFRKPAPADRLVALRRDGKSVFEPKPFTGKLEIRKAAYGVLTVDIPDVVDVTALLSAMVRENRLSVRADNSIAGDPAVNVVKQLRVQYAIGGEARAVTVEENQTLVLPRPEDGPVPAGARLEIRRALYGIIPEGAPSAGQTRSFDVTEALAGLVRDGRLSVVAGNTLAGDPAPQVVKQLRVEYALNGETYTRTIAENDTLFLPDGTEQGMAGSDLPAAEVSLSTRGAPVVTAWEPGAYEAATASGKVLRASVIQVPAPVEVAGPWELRFPPKWGAPAKVSLDRLLSWTESDDPGIRYFSGTATYVKEVEIPAALLAADCVPVLDLGTVREIAEVRVNGKELGIFWKPPFRVPLAGVAKPGKNQVEIRVTNLWPNRLIGDEELPDDCEWRGAPMKEWPQWLLEKKPRPQTGRVTFTTWKHWVKGSPLIPSGLLGPVTLRAARKAELTGM